jgi:hypothetical protein
VRTPSCSGGLSRARAVVTSVGLPPAFSSVSAGHPRRVAPRLGDPPQALSCRARAGAMHWRPAAGPAGSESLCSSLGPGKRTAGELAPRRGGAHRAAVRRLRGTRLRSPGCGCEAGHSAQSDGDETGARAPVASLSCRFISQHACTAAATSFTTPTPRWRRRRCGASSWSSHRVVWVRVDR